MKKSEPVKKIILNGCLINTVCVFAVAALANLFPKEGFAPSFTTVAMILLFSMLISAAGLLLSLKRMNLAMRVFIHYITVAALFYLIFIVWGGFAARAIVTLFAMLLFTAIYAAAMLLYAVFKKRDKAPDTSDYEKQF